MIPNLLPRRVASSLVKVAIVPLLAMACAAPALAQTITAPTPSTINPADTAWMTVATAFVLMMTVPGLALFYAGMVRKKNVLATMAQSLAAVAMISILWVVYGYSLAFVGDGAGIGTLHRFMLSGMTMDSVSASAKTIPEALFVLYQMTFGVIAVALIAGSVADRMRFSSYMLFSAGWFTLVYVPLAHWIWGGGFLGQAGVLDFAGGLVVHLSAGTAGLVACLMLGSRRGYGSENLAPYDLSLAVIGTGLLWVGWFGFNGGSALQANSRAVMAIMSTHLAACAGALIWSALEWVTRRKPSVLGMISGAVAGLGTITPASGFVSPAAGILIGLVAGAVCFWACTALKHRFKYDDTLDVFGIHGIGGLLGTLAVGIFASSAIGGTAGLLEGNPHQLLLQAYGVVVTLVWTAGVTWALLKAIDLMVTLRVSRENEVEGLDITQHGEALQ